jgi:hypothetical protein
MRLVVLLLLSAATSFGYCNDTLKVRNNSVYFELTGNGYNYSWNYERIVMRTEKMKIAQRVGFSRSPSDDYDFNSKKYYTKHVPLETNFLFGTKRSLFESGVGYTYRIEYVKNSVNVYNEINNTFDTIESIDKEIMHTFFLRIGYRFQANNGFLFRIAILPVLYDTHDSKIEEKTPLWAGLAVGYSF